MPNIFEIPLPSLDEPGAGRSSLSIDAATDLALSQTQPMPLPNVLETAPQTGDAAPQEQAPGSIEEAVLAYITEQDAVDFERMENDFFDGYHPETVLEAWEISEMVADHEASAHKHRHEASLRRAPRPTRPSGRRAKPDQRSKPNHLKSARTRQNPARSQRDGWPLPATEPGISGLWTRLVSALRR